jgi:hypothetical protein
LPIHSAIVVRASITKPFNYLYSLFVCVFKTSNKIYEVFSKKGINYYLPSSARDAIVVTADYLTIDIPEIVNYNKAVINYGICYFMFEYFIP